MCVDLCSAFFIIATGDFPQGRTPDNTLNNVTRYNRTGQTETLPQLNVGRYDHACGSYLTDEGKIVRFIFNLTKYWIIVIQVLLVTGGAEYAQGHFVHGWDDLASTEVLEDAAGAWRLTNPLPSVRKGLVAASVMNTIYVMGDSIILWYLIYTVFDNYMF